jgi:hypothetical protein
MTDIMPHGWCPWKLGTQALGLDLLSLFVEASLLRLRLPWRKWVHNESLPQQGLNSCGWLGSDCEPLFYSRGIQLSLLLEWVVPAQVLQGLAVPPSPAIKSDEAVEGKLVATPALETNSNPVLDKEPTPGDWSRDNSARTWLLELLASEGR